MTIDLDKIKKVHFTGIGGVGMSSLAAILHFNGYRVTGSDIRVSTIVERLQKSGIEIAIGHAAENVDGTELLVYTAAVKQDNVELVRARELGLPVIERSDLLGMLMSQYKERIAIAGTHGKTTTTSMLSIIFKELDLDPTVLIGGDVDALGGNVRLGKSELFVTEACEYVGAFLKLSPWIGIILNIDADHMDYYKTMDNLVKAFRDFAHLIPKEGCLVAFADNDYILDILPELSCNVITFGIGDDADWWPDRIIFDRYGYPEFDVMHKGQVVTHVKLHVPGLHNVHNALACLAACHFAGIDVELAAQALETFHGTHRRFENKGVVDGVTVVDDYAHHPTEIEATLHAAQNIPHERIWCVFQPHLFSRTKALLHEFAHALKLADKVIVTDIYPAREVDLGEVSSLDLVRLVEKAQSDCMYIPSFFDVIDYLDKELLPGDIVITMGAGDIYQVGEELLKSGRKARIDLKPLLKN